MLDDRAFFFVGFHRNPGPGKAAPFFSSEKIHRDWKRTACFSQKATEKRPGNLLNTRCSEPAKCHFASFFMLFCDFPNLAAFKKDRSFHLRTGTMLPVPARTNAGPVLFLFFYFSAVCQSIKSSLTQPHSLSLLSFAIRITSSWLCFVFAIPVAMLVMQAIPSTFMPR